MGETLKAGINWVKDALTKLGIPAGLVSLILFVYGGLSAVSIDVFGYPLSSWFIWMVSFLISVAIVGRFVIWIMIDIKKQVKVYNEV